MTLYSSGSPEPKGLRECTGRSGTHYKLSQYGYFWYPASGGLIYHWPELLRVDGPLTPGRREPEPLALFDLDTLTPA
ncbi:hypothetical protein [Amycolatopsis sp. DSM 110486]|uniref:hypothetical protein n=1 Tax=Amycolatopsis sp. DSM 110486 TaxID=2865832 RepID=UPI001C699A23|nr:hypothetical protein [Amycolatopsis sp. DSM 110486]QYN17549.1 hypothetical protein K1T34_32710 [Amycolatopsis sp. DSM 110486]